MPLLKRINKKILALAIIALSPLVLTGCTLSNLPGIGKYFTKTQATVAQPVDLSMWGLWEPKDIMDTLITDYKGAHSTVTINYEERSFINLKSYKDSVSTRLKEGSAPDIILVHDSWVPSLVPNLAPAPDGVISTDDFYNVAKDMGTSNGKVYAVPMSYDGLALLYNKTMFTAAGVTEPPKTWEEFRVVASKLTKTDPKGNISQAGAAIGSANNVEHFSDILGLLFAQAGVKVPDDLASQSASDAVTFYTEFVTSEKVWSDVLPPSVQAFSDGKVAMVFVPSWELLSILNKNPQLNVGVAPVPRALDATTGSPINVDWASFWMLSVSKSSKNPAAAWDFIKFLVQPDQQRKLFSEQAKVRTFGEPYALKSLQGELSGNAYLDVYVKSGDTAKSGILASQSGNDDETDVLKTAINSILSGTTPTEALATAQKNFK